MDGRIHLYNAAFYHRFHVPVRTILVLLRPEADHSGLTGELYYQSGKSRVEFGYEVIRLWEQPAWLFLEGGLGVLPLASLCKTPEAANLSEEMAKIVVQIDQRLRCETTPAEAAKLMTATFILAGLRLDRSTLAGVFRGLGIMKESSGYQLILEEGEIMGRIKEIQQVLLRLGRKRFGPPDEATETL